MKKFVVMMAAWIFFVVTGFSQTSAGPPPSDTTFPKNGDWHIEWVPAYLWFTAVGGNLGVGGKSIPISASFSDVLDKLNIAYMTAADVRKHKIGLLTDFQYLDLSSNEISTPYGLLYSSAHTDSQQYILDPEIYARVFESSRGSVDGIAGIRYWHLRSNLDLRAGLLPAFHAGDSKDWVDPVMGARFRLNLRKGWFVMLKGDAGGFGAGSQKTWQIYTGGGKEFKQRYSAFLGYRRLSVDYRDGGFIYDTNINGALAGFSIKFK